MIGLVNKFAAKIEDKKGALSEDEVSLVYLFVCEMECVGWHLECSSQYFCLFAASQTIQFKSYLLSVGIANPVTK